MEEIINSDNKNLVFAQQSGIVITAVATLAMASIKIFKLIKSPTEAIAES